MLCKNYFSHSPKRKRDGCDEDGFRKKQKLSDETGEVEKRDENGTVQPDGDKK